MSPSTILTPKRKSLHACSHNCGNPDEKGSKRKKSLFLFSAEQIPLSSFCLPSLEKLFSASSSSSSSSSSSDACMHEGTTDSVALSALVCSADFHPLFEEGPSPPLIPFLFPEASRGIPEHVDGPFDVVAARPKSGNTYVLKIYISLRC